MSIHYKMLYFYQATSARSTNMGMTHHTADGPVRLLAPPVGMMVSSDLEPLLVADGTAAAEAGLVDLVRGSAVSTKVVSGQVASTVLVGTLQVSTKKP